MSSNAQFLYGGLTASAEERVESLLGRMTREEKVGLLSGGSVAETRSNERLGIPAMRMTDGPHGVGGGEPSTSFPVGVAMGACWNSDLIREVGAALGREMQARGRHLLLGPCVNIHRTPLGGRNFESFGEDPYLAARTAVAYVEGVQSRGIGTSTKHFAVNNQERKRNTIDVKVDERALREIYLPAFKAAVTEAGTWTVMGAYNKVNGSYCCENTRLLTDILKGEWGFKGFVVSDWGACHSTVESANAGLDLEMDQDGPGFREYFTAALLEAVARGDVSEAVIDDKVRRILRVISFVGLFDDEDSSGEGALNGEEHQGLARQVARESIVLLKNERDLLPLQGQAIKSIAVIGPNAADARLGGQGSSTVVPFYTVSPLEGLKRRSKDSMAIRYARGCVLVDDLVAVESAALRPPDAPEGVYGLRGEYFNNPDLSDEPHVVRIDSQVDFRWGQGAPAAGVAPGRFSVRWTGKLIPSQTSRYELGMSNDEGIRLYLDGDLLIDHWLDHPEETRAVGVDLEAGRPYDIRLEFRGTVGWAVVKLGWLTTGDLRREAIEAAGESDVAIVFAGLSARYEGEGFDRNTLDLPGGQDGLIEAVAEANRNTIVVLVNGSPLLMDRWLDNVPAVLEAWYPGQEGGNAIAEILFGDVDPSGRMPVTFPRRLEDSSSFASYPGCDGEVHYAEGIFVGYRHFEKKDIEPLFPFGHGLSYTTFKYSNLNISHKRIEAGEGLGVSLEIENTGERDGQEVVQLYIRDIEASIERPIKELKGFRKVRLKPGEKKIVTLSLNSTALAFFDPEGGTWVAEPGEFEVLIGSSSQDIRLKGRFTLGS